MIKLIDNHGHIMFPEKINTTVNQAEELVKELRIDKISFLSWPPKAPDYMKIDYTENLKILYLKEKLEIPVYAYFAFDEYSKDANLNAEFIKRMVEIGFDGWKSMEMHPKIYRKNKMGLNHPCFVNTLKYAEENDIPIICHLGDPKESWDFEKASDWVKANGRFYNDTFPSLKQLYDEMDEVFQKFPNLKIALAHFYFVSDNYEKATSLLDTYKNVYMDLTPGTEMYWNFSKDNELWKDFFCKYRKRILMGSDLYPAGYGVERHKLVRNFLEKSAPFTAQPWNKRVIPLNLPQEILEDIYVNNIHSFSSIDPKPVNREMAYKYCEYILENHIDKLTNLEKENLKAFMDFWGKNV